MTEQEQKYCEGVLKEFDSVLDSMPSGIFEDIFLGMDYSICRIYHKEKVMTVMNILHLGAVKVDEHGDPTTEFIIEPEAIATHNQAQ